MEISKETMKRLLGLIAFGIAFYLGLVNIYRLQAFFGWVVNILQPLILGFVVAYTFNILLRMIELRAFAWPDRHFKKIWPVLRRPCSILLSLLIVIGALVLMVLIIVPDIVSTATNIANNIPSLFNRMQSQYYAFLTKYPEVSRYFSNIRIDWSSISQMMTQHAQQFANNLVGSTILITTNLFNGFLTVILGFVISINILLSKEKLKRQLRKFLFAYLPKDYPQRAIRVLRLTDEAFTDFIAGQCLGAVILGVLCYFGMLVLRFPYPLLISVLVALLALLPILGQIFSVIIGALLILTVSPIQALWFIVYINVLQQLNGNLIYPKVVGSKIGLPTLWVLVAITLGGNLFGILGMLVSIPLFSVAHTLLSENVRRRLAQKRNKPAQAETQNAEET